MLPLHTLHAQGQSYVHQPAGDPTYLSLRCQYPECGKRFKTHLGLKLHLAVHRGQYRYHCQYCGQGFSATNNLKGHLVKHTGIKTFVCHICKDEFSYGNVLKAHVQKYHGDVVPTTIVHVAKETPNQDVCVPHL